MKPTGRIDIHDYSKRLDSALETLKNSDLSDCNKGLIFKYKRDCFLQNLGKARILKYVRTLMIICRRVNKDLDKLTKEDIQAFLTGVYQRDDYTIWTKKDYAVTIKRFFKCLKGNNEEYPDEVKWIRTTVRRKERKLIPQGDLLKEDDIKKLIEKADHVRDKALISCLWETGCRIGELAGIKFKDLSTDEFGYKVNVDGKTGPRTLRFIDSTPHLATWLNNHPLKNDREAGIWVNTGTRKKGSQMSYASIRILLIRLFKKAGITKHFNPHLFRHSRATFLASYLNEQQMNAHFGWIQGSDMPSVYVKLNGKDIEDKMLEISGIKKIQKEDKESKLKPIKCGICSETNAYSAQFCAKCGRPLSLKIAIEKEEETKQKMDGFLERFIMKPLGYKTKEEFLAAIEKDIRI